MSVPINLDWGQFKGFVNQFALVIDYAPEGIHYFLWSSNGSVMLSAYITDPTDVLDFETNYKPFAFEVSIPPGDGGPGTLVVQGTTPWVTSITGIVSLPTGASTAAKQDTGNASLSSIDTKVPSQGQALMAASTPVVIASNQSTVPVSATQSGVWAMAQLGAWSVDAVQSGPWSVTQSGVWTVAVSGTVPISAASLPLPAGASTEATLALIKTDADRLDVALSTRATETTLATRNAEATQLLVKAKTDNLDTLLSTRNTEATQLLVKAKTDNLDIALSTRATEATLATRLSESTFNAGVSIGYSAGKTVIGKTATLVTTAVTADQVILTYTVTAGKTFYLLGFDWAVGATSIAHADTDFGNISLETPSGTKIQTWFARGAGRDAFVRSISEPLPIASGTVIRLVVTPSAATSTTWVANVIGYEK